MLAEVEAALNTRLDGQYLFAGSRSDAAPGGAAGDADHDGGPDPLLSGRRRSS